MKAILNEMEIYWLAGLTGGRELDGIYLIGEVKEFIFENVNCN